MIRIAVAVVFLAFPSTVVAQVARLDIRYVEVDVSKMHKTTDEYLANLKKAREKSDAEAIFSLTKGFFQSTREQSVSITRDVQGAMSLDEYGNGELRRGQGSGSESLQLNATCQGRKGEILDVTISCESAPGRDHFVRATSLGLRTEQFAETIHFPVDVNSEGPGDAATRCVGIFIVKLTTTLSE